VIENVGRRSETWSEEGSPTQVGENSLNGYERNSLFWNLGGGNFVDVGFLTQSDRIEDGRAVVVSDFDRDGRLDLLVQNLDKPAVLLMGRGEVGNWLQVDLEGTRSNREALGAIVTARIGRASQARQVAAGSGFIARSSATLHFGLGEADSVEALEIRWPSGHIQTLYEVAANQRLRVVEAGGFAAFRPGGLPSETPARSPGDPSRLRGAWRSLRAAPR
jgi:hypothetical protein